MPTENERFNDVQKWKESKAKMKSRNIQEYFNDIANGRDIGPIPTLSPEYIAFVEWTHNSTEDWNYYWEDSLWIHFITGEERTTEQLFIYFMEKVYKK